MSSALVFYFQINLKCMVLLGEVTRWRMIIFSDSTFEFYVFAVQ